MTKLPTDNQLNWQNVACFSVVALTAIAAVIFAPIWAHGLRLANQMRENQSQARIALANQGLSSCPVRDLDYYDDVDKIIDESLKGKPRVSITAMPSFSPEWGVRLINNDVYLVRLESSFWAQRPVFEVRNGKYQLRSGSTRITFKINHANMAPGTALRLTQLFGKSIANVQETPGLGADGVSYRFRAPGVGCGRTWSPDPATRAGQLVDILELLSAHAQLTDPYELNASERQINRLLNSLRAP